MIRAYVSELIRFRKTASIGVGVMIFITAMISMFLFVGTGGFGPGGGDEGGPPGFGVDLTAADGAVGALSTATDMLGVVALALFALSVARDFEFGTIRNLLVGEPRRITLLAGKLLALATLVVVGIAVSAVAAAGLGLALAPGQGIPTDAWTLTAALSTMGSVGAAVLLYGLIGAAIAMVTRTSAISITAGVGYLLIGENLVSLIWDTAGEWLPAGILSAFAQGGTELVSLERAATLAVVYGFASLAVLFIVFARRDVTD